MIEGEVTLHGLYRHKRTGMVYRVVSAPSAIPTQMKLGDSEWAPCIIYVRAEGSNGLFVRDLEKFKLNFEEVK